MKSKRSYDDEELEEDYDESEDVEDEQPAKRKKGLRFLIGLGIFILIIALIYGWFRYRATLIMDNFPLYAINQDYDAIYKGTLHGEDFGENVRTFYDDEVEGSKKISYITMEYVSAKTDAKTTGFIIFIVFDNTEHAKEYLHSQKYEENRDKHIMNNYYFDEPGDFRYNWQTSIGTTFYGILTLPYSEFLEN